MENLLEYSARRNELDWAVRNKAKLTPEQRAKYRAMWEEMNSSTPPSSSTAEVSFGPADLDPVEAAATPIAPDPVVAPKRPAMPKPSLTDTMESANTLASLDNFDAAFQSNGNHYPTAVAAFAQQLVARGVDPAYAQRAARARAEEHRSPYSRDVYADEMAATENPNELYAGYRNAPGGAPAVYGDSSSGRPDADPRTTRAERLAQSERWAADVDRRAAEYNRDTGLTPPDTSVADERGPYPGAGRPGYDRTLTFDEVMASRAAAEEDRAARMQPMLDADRRDMQDREEWRRNNPEDAAKLAAKQRERSDDYRRERLLYRQAQQTGIPIDQLRAENPGFTSVGSTRDGSGIPTLTRTKNGMELRDMPTSTPSMRDAAAQKRIDAATARESAWRSQMMLAGNNPRKNAVNAWNAMGDESLNDWQRATMAKALRPDMDGTTPLTVDANSAKNAMRLLNAEMIGQGGLGDTRAKMMESQERDKAFAFAEREARKMGLMGYWKPSMTRQEAERLRRRVEAMHPGMGSVVDALPITEEGESPAGPSTPAPPPGASGAPVPPMPSGRPGPPRPGSGSRYPNT